MHDGAVLQLEPAWCIIVLTKKYRFPVSRNESVSQVVIFHILRDLTCMYLLDSFYFSKTISYPVSL